MQWQALADISAVDPLLPADLACFRELRDVLQRYGALDRFGIALIHRHFDIADDEELMEYTDAETRPRKVKPVKESDIDWQHTTLTNWNLTEDEEVARTGCSCARNSGGNLGYHGAPEAGWHRAPSDVGLSCIWLPQAQSASRMHLIPCDFFVARKLLICVCEMNPGGASRHSKRHVQSMPAETF